MKNRLSSVARRIIERCTRDWVYKRRLPTAFGQVPIFVTPSAGIKYIFKPMRKVDPILLRNVLELVRPNDVVWDIGANIGLFAFAAAARAGPNGQVIAFEPDTWLIQILRKSATAQPRSSASVTIVPAAVACTLALREFAIASRSRAYNAFPEYGHPQMGNVHGKQTVVALGLDWLADTLPAPTILKCDTEGAEIEIFSCQSRMLNSVRPVVIVEVGAQSAELMTSVLLKQRYSLYDGDKPLSAQSRICRASWNTIAIPEELRGRYAA
jgi:FkbM family methyltransferase